MAYSPYLLKHHPEKMGVEGNPTRRPKNNFCILSKIHSCNSDKTTCKPDTVCFFSHSFHAVELLRQGYSPIRAARTALKRIAQYYPTFRGGLITVTKDGRYGKAKMQNMGIIMKLNSKLDKPKCMLTSTETRKDWIFSWENLKCTIYFS